ncbi:CNVH-domain-containing protein [Dothidotthia symphoricarpi CBS 119687]|uniref:CNVH-domain-containing protein n=1 Tax=Dothidotthia symphoricarpi CBS 119687 TaxID=1392245 RepID=A0A6A6ACH1_9PLEO|nr:CNVH-domain-containing protein [Dothidotthia symphoricarpi CBS 119687]KAF2128684.1 CNVH-domain-containing protein [Dothidotthia symphoricarpi CBS 119687]
MPFHYSAEEGSIRIEDNHILKARLKDINGNYQDAEIDLNNHIGNENGHFSWDATGFGGSAENVHFSIEGDGSVPVLRAGLQDVEGNYQERDLNLAERIENNNGTFYYSTIPRPYIYLVSAANVDSRLSSSNRISLKRGILRGDSIHVPAFHNLSST